MQIMSKEFLKSYIDDNGILLLNPNKFSTSLMEIDSDLNNIMLLIEEREVFYCKAFYNKTTFLSKEIYYYIKQLKRSKTLRGKEKEIYNLLRDSTGVNTDIIIKCLNTDKKSIEKIMNKLLKGLYITVLSRDKIINKRWNSYLWGTCEQWEQNAKIIRKDMTAASCKNMIINKLSCNYKINDIENLLK